MVNYPTMDDYNWAEHGDPKAIAKINTARRDSFITRMVREYKASLVSYVARCQNYITEFNSETDGHEHSTYRFWRAELVEATRQLELSDAELLAFIKPAPPYRIAKPIKEESFGHHCLKFPCPDCA